MAGDLLDNDVDSVTVQKLLGHVSVETTASYDRRRERARRKRSGRCMCRIDGGINYALWVMKVRMRDRVQACLVLTSNSTVRRPF